MAAKKSYRWRPAPAPWRVGQNGDSKTSTEESSSPPGEGGKKTGTIVLVLVGAATVAFGVMELLGITKVFAQPPAALPAGAVPTGAPPAGSGTPAATPAAAPLPGTK